jgi:hypothetical protein
VKRREGKPVRSARAIRATNIHPTDASASMALARAVGWRNTTREIPLTTGALLCAHSLEGEMEANRRRNDDRRQNADTPSFPFKDSNGVTIKECRRKIPDRRLNNIQAEWVEEILIK